MQSQFQELYLDVALLFSSVQKHSFTRKYILAQLPGGPFGIISDCSLDSINSVLLFFFYIPKHHIWAFSLCVFFVIFGLKLGILNCIV